MTEQENPNPIWGTQPGGPLLRQLILEAFARAAENDDA